LCFQGGGGTGECSASWPPGWLRSTTALPSSWMFATVSQRARQEHTRVRPLPRADEAPTASDSFRRPPPGGWPGLGGLPDRGLFEGLEAVALEEIHPKDLVAAIEVDAEAALSEMDMSAITRMNSYGPFGNGNPDPSSTHPTWSARSQGGGRKAFANESQTGDDRGDGIGFGLADRYDPDNRR